MEQVIFYQLITPNKIKALHKLLIRWVNDGSLAGCHWIENMLEKVNIGFHLIISTSVEKATVYTQPDSIDNIRLISIWRNEPNKYRGLSETITFTGIPTYTGPSKELKTLIQELQSIFSNTQQNGKSENRLQKEGAAGAGLSEGRILYGGRDIPEYSAGRHCDQAGAQESSIGDSRPQVILSSRCSQILSTQG